MRTAVLGLALLLAARPAVAAPDDKPDAKGLSPGEEVQKLIADFQKAQDDAFDKMRQAKTDEERTKIAREDMPNNVPVVARLLELAEKNPKDKDVNPKALLWVVGHSGHEPKDKALGILARDYAANEEIGDLCLGLAQRAPSDAAEKLMRAVMDSDGPAALKGKAALALGEYLRKTAGVARQLKQEPDAAKRIASFVDQDLVARLAKADPEQMEADAEKQLETAANEYADVALGRTTVGELARGELFELRYLSIGKAAPEIEGEDLDGKPFKLSDYRGKVVVLDFWGNW